MSVNTNDQTPWYPSYGWVGSPSGFNYSDPDTGGDSSTMNVNQWFETGNVGFIITGSCGIALMIPGLGFLYSGLARRKSALTMIWLALGSYAVMTFQWYFWGYSLAFSRSATNGFIGDLHRFALQNTLGVASQGSPLIPDLLYALFQLQFAATTAAIIMGAPAERGRIIPAMVFVFCWATIVYSPLAYWIWNANGWAFKYQVMDFAGGGPVEINSGMAALAYSYVLGKRRSKMMQNFRPHNVSLITLGTVLLYFGWMFFNGGSAFGSNLRAVMAIWNTMIAGFFGAISWVILDWRLARKISMVGFCSGWISGLVAATPASGFIMIHGSIPLGITAGVICNLSTKIKYLIRIDDAMDVFAEHAVGGIIGLIFNALFGASYIIGLDGVNTGIINGGWPNSVYKQLYVQIAYIVAVAAYSFVVSFIIAFAINRIPGLHLRASEEAELLGMDEDQLGEFAYDYVEVRRDYLAWSPNHGESVDNEEGNGRFDEDHTHGIPENRKMMSEIKKGHSGTTSEDSTEGQVPGDRHAVAVEEKEHGNGTR